MRDVSAVREDVRQFHIHSCLGSGGFGEVYRATMTSAGGVSHEVAVKVLHDGLDPRSQAVQRLRDEGKLLALLRHPSILSVHDLVILNGRVALVTEYVEGGDLDTCFSQGGMSTRALVDAIGRVAAALDAAWTTIGPEGQQLQLVHRDVKPANIRIGKHGEVKLLDFGIATAAGVKREAETQAKALIGSYLYMSPERLDRKDSKKPAGDIYALGAVLYEGVTERRFFGDIELKEQYKLAWNAEEHDGFVKQIVDSIEGLEPAIADLILEMMQHDEDARPKPADLARRCDRMADEMSGASLRQWAWDYNWPVSTDLPGELGGKTITEAGFTTGAGLHGHETFIEVGVDTMAPGLGDQSGGDPGASSGRNWMILGVVAVCGIVLVAVAGIGGLAAVGGMSMLAGEDPQPVPVPAPIIEEPAPVVAEPEPVVEEPEPIPASPEPAPPQPIAVAPRPVAPAPEPAPPKPKSNVGTVVVEGGVDIHLKGAAGTFAGGSIPAGTYEIHADFGDGLIKAFDGPLTVPAGGAVTVKCSALRHSCKPK